MRTTIQSVKFPSQNMILMAGPCQIESREHCFRMAEALCKIVRDLPVDFVFKASYDKANRTSHESPRGVGLMQGLQILYDVRDGFGCRVTSDVHSVIEAHNFLDVVQIPALLCRQTDILQSAAGAPVVNIKKGPFMAPAQMRHAVSKVRNTDPDSHVWITERGTTFGYGDLVVDMRGLVAMRTSSGADGIIFDASHSCQRPGENINASGGDRKFIEPLARAALAVGVDGLFIETHDDPDGALSDGDIAVPLDEFGDMLKRLLEVWEIGKHYRHSDAQGFAAAAE